MITVFGISNCTTVQKARKWLADNEISYEFHDYKKIGIDTSHLKQWCAQFGWESVLNRKGMMWRKASDSDKASVIDEDSAIEFMMRVPNSIKRPIIEFGDGLLLGFDAQEYLKLI